MMFVDKGVVILTQYMLLTLFSSTIMTTAITTATTAMTTTLCFRNAKDLKPILIN